MRALTVIAIFILASASSAWAERWGNFAFEDAGVDIQFPAAPTVTPGSYPTAKGSVPSVVYAFADESRHFTLTVADFAKHGGEQKAAVQSAIAAARAGGNVTLDVNECISGRPGRELSIAGADGSTLKVSVFTVGDRFYLLEAKVSPPNAKRDSGDAARFQQSLSFGRDFRPEPVCRGRAAEASRVSP